MAPLTTTRTLFEVRVGAFHTIEVLLQIRQSDVSWWNSDLRCHERQLHKLLGLFVLPVECSEEIEEFHSKRKMKEERKAGIYEAQKAGKKKVNIGEDNLKKKASRKRGIERKGDAKSQKKQNTADNKSAKGADDSSKEKRSKPFQDPGTWVIAPGYTIQLCYRVEDIESATTLVFRPKKNIILSETDAADGNKKQSTKNEDQTQHSLDDNDKKSVRLASFRKWTKLKKRVNVWVFKLDTANPCDLSHSEGGGFPRPDLLPMADIFRTVVDNE